MTDGMSLAVFDPIKALTVKTQERDAALELDHTTPEGEKELRSWVCTVRGCRAGLEKIRVKAKADSLEYGRKVDSLAKELKAPFDTIINERMKPLDDIEAAKRAAAEAVIEAERLEAERIEAERLADLKRREDEVTRKEAEQKAAEDAANAERLKAERIERDKRIAEEAAEKARAEAEAKAKAEADEQERLRLAAEAKVQQDKERAEEAERKRVGDETHRAMIHEQIFGALNDIIGDNKITEPVLFAISDGNIPHVTINY